MNLRLSRLGLVIGRSRREGELLPYRSSPIN
jgi:hypothetical protein